MPQLQLNRGKAANLLVAVGGGGVLAVIDDALGAGEVAADSSNIDDALQAIDDYFGGLEPGDVNLNNDGDIYIMKDGDYLRFDLNDPHGDDPHFHIQDQDPNGNLTDTGPQHRYYFKP